MNLRDIMRGIQFVGLGNALRTLIYTRRKARMDRSHMATGAPPVAYPPGRLQEASGIPSGATFRYQFSKLEVYFLAPDLARLSWQPGELPLPYALANTNWPGAEVTLEQSGEAWAVRSSELVLHVGIDGGVSFFDAEGNLLRRDHPPERQGPRWRHRSELRAEERIYGLGERAAALNLRPGSYRMWNRDPGGNYGPGTDPLYLGIPVYLALHEAGSHLTFFENTFDGSFEFGEDALAHFDGGCLRSYFTPGPPSRALRRYADLTGNAPLPPRWALGYHQCRWSYMSEDEVRELVQGFQDHDLPLDAVHLDIHYMRGYRVFSIDKKRFPDLKAMADELSAQGIRLVTILDPGVKADPRYPLYREGRERGFFCKMPDGSDVVALVWPGRTSWPDFSDPRVRNWWMEQYPKLLQHGASGIWHDMNEPAAFSAGGDPTLPLATRHAMEGRGGTHSEAHNIYGLLMNQAGYEALRNQRPELRPFLFSRSGWAGVQRYAWVWTADISSTWESLRQCVPSILGLGLSGIPFAGTDIGGFSGHPSAELYLRWFQMAAFQPFFRTHSALTTPRREPWCFGQEAVDIIRRFLLLRKRLMPYLYTLAWEASQHGQPLVRPLLWHSVEDMDLWDVDDCFLLGEKLLVAPILEEGIASRTVRLPSGGWYDFWTDEQFIGPGEIERRAGLESIPLMVRAGSLLPLQEGEKLVLHVYPPLEGESTSQLYSDAGEGYGPGRLDAFRIMRSKEGVLVEWQGTGEFPLPYASIDVQVHGMPVARIELDGKDAASAGGRVSLTAPFKRLRLEGR